MIKVITDTNMELVVDTAIYEEFYTKGYIVLRNQIPLSIVHEWSEVFAHPSFLQSILDVLYDNHHIVHPSLTLPHREEPTSCTASNHSTDTNNDTNEVQKYTMMCGMKYGYREIVMRSPGRYEIALLPLFNINDFTAKSNQQQQHVNVSSNNNNNRRQQQMQQIFLNHSTTSNRATPQQFISSIIDTVQSSLPFLPNLLNQQPPPPPTPSSFCDNNNHDVNSTTVSQQQQQQQQQQQPYTTWSQVNIINISILISTPGSTDQKWHADGGHVNIEHHLPCHCCNLFIPLTPITSQNGPTEFRPQSQYYTRQLTKLLLLAKARKELHPIDAPLVSELGDIILFDYRILHRGRGNRSNILTNTNAGVATTSSSSSSVTAKEEEDEQNTAGHTNVTSTSTTIQTEISTNRKNSAANVGPPMIPSSDHICHNNRVILVVTVALPWFRDVLNFPKSRSIYDVAEGQRAK
jgi:hypothetical protein